MIKSSIVTAGYALISLLCLSSSSLSQDSDYIELPFEFFHGRWVQGHSAEFKSTYVDYRGPDYFGSYNFISGNNRLSILDIQKYILVNEKFESWRTANISFLKRVKPNWEVGIDRFTYNEFKTDSRSATFPPFQTYSQDRYSLTIAASSKYSRNKTLRIIPEMEAYSYFFEPILSRGDLRFENSIRMSHDRQDYFSIFTPDSISSGRSTITDRTYNNWLFRNNLIWGITDRLNLVANYANLYRTTRQTSYVEFIRQGSLYSQSFEIRNSSEYRPWISLSVTQALTTSSFLKIGYQNFLRQSTFKSTGYTNFIETNSFRINSTEFERELETIRLIWSANFQFVNAGEFKSGVMLDDYRNFYKSMLFKRQFALDIGLYHMTSGSNNAYNTSIIVLPTLGVSNHINVAGKVAYSFSRNRSNLASEEIQSSLSVRFRNYSYNKEVGSNWNEDNRYDQVFGRKLKSGQAFIDIRYYPPRFLSINTENISIFSFAKMRNSKVHIIALNAIVGLGTNFELTISGSENYHTELIPTRRYDLGLSKRFLNKMDLSISYIQSSIGSNFNDPAVQLSIRALI